MMVKTFDRIELLDKLETIQENDPFIDLEYNNCKIEREDPVSYISDDDEDDDDFLRTKMPNCKTTLSRPTNYMNAIRTVRIQSEESERREQSEQSDNNNDTDESDPLNETQLNVKPRFLVDAAGLLPTSTQFSSELKLTASASGSQLISQMMSHHTSKKRKAEESLRKAEHGKSRKSY